LAEKGLVEVAGPEEAVTVRITENGHAWRRRLVVWLTELFGSL
jgi:hypothetical protein